LPRTSSIKSMNKIQKLFSGNKKNILSVYFTAGFPKLNDTAVILAELQKAGVNMIEIGMPFSDPLADGPTIQHSSEIALRNGMSLKRLFAQLKRSAICDSPAPVLLMGYLNPVLQFGMEKFCKCASEAGISGVILPDLPMDEFLSSYKKLFDRYGLKNIFLVTPQTSAERIKRIDKLSEGFIYLVSSASTTGTKKGISPEQKKYFKRILKMKLKNPLMIGFGISDRMSFETACSYSNGAIIGSAFIKVLESKTRVNNFIKSIR